MNITSFFKSKQHSTQPVSFNAKDIHKEVFSAMDVLIKENDLQAKELLSDSEKEKLARTLNDMGFTRASNVGLPVAAADKLKGIEWYAQNVPNYKFIDEDTVKRICEKYNLYLCSVNDYIADIPLKNQKDIAEFKIQETALLNYERVPTPRYYDDLLKTSNDYRKEYEAAWQARSEKIKALDNSFEWVGCQNLKIIAPESKIDMRWKTKRGHQIVNDDPIVLQPVKWGYLIVTAWGDEASDEMVVNQKMN